MTRLLTGVAVWLLAPAASGALMGLAVAWLVTRPALALPVAALVAAGLVRVLLATRPSPVVDDTPSRGRHPSARPAYCLCCPGRPRVDDLATHSRLAHDSRRPLGVEDTRQWRTTS